MEDNEFEEVTIISHTELPRPEQTHTIDVGEVRKRVSMETVQELYVKGKSPITKVDDPRLAPGLRELEKLKQDHFAEFQSCAFAPFAFIARVAGESGQYLLGADGKTLVSNGRESRVIDTGRGSVSYV